MEKAKDTSVQGESQTFSHQLRERLGQLEKRDWELWILAVGMLGILAGGFFFVLVPAVFMGQDTLYIEANISPQLMFGLLVMVLSLMIYLVQKQMQIRKLRFKSFTDAWSFEISHVQMLIDPLTQAYSRGALEELLMKEIKRVQRNQSSLILLYIDVNDFKRVNTRFGHLSGDLVLAEVGGVLKQCVRGSDYVIRMGGDEFLVALVDTDMPGATVVKQRMNQRVAEWNRSSPLPGFTLTLSIGVQQYDSNQSLDEVLAAADQKMYAEKKELQ